MTARKKPAKLLPCPVDVEAFCLTMLRLLNVPESWIKKPIKPRRRAKAGKKEKP